MTFNDPDTPLNDIVISTSSVPALITVDIVFHTISVTADLTTPIGPYPFDLTISDGYSEILVPF